MIELALGQEQAEFFDLLARGEEVAFSCVGEKLQRVRADALILPREAGGEPLR